MKKVLVTMLLTMALFTLSGCVEEPPTYTVTLNYNDDAVANDTLSVEGGSFVVEPTQPTKAGFAFEGWYSDSTLNTPFDFATTLNGNITLYAKWTENDYNIIYHSNGGTEYASEVHQYGDTLTIPSDPTKDDAVFIGWYLDDSFETLFEFTTMPAEDLDLYAKWDVIFGFYFIENGGAQLENLSLAEGASIPTLPIPEKLGHTFNGWYNELTYDTVFALDTMPSEDVIVYAKWTPNLYDLTFYDFDGGSTTTTVTFGDEIPVPEDTTVEGYTFAGWYIDDEFTIPLGTILTFAEDLSIYGKWVEFNQILSISISNEPYTLAPGYTASRESVMLIKNLYEGLVRDVNGVFEPGIAESWSVSSDGLTWTFNLRQSYWSNGEELTASDFVYSWQEFADPENSAEYNWLWLYTNIVNAEAVFMGFEDKTSLGVYAEDDQTLVIELEQPSHHLLSMVSYPTFYPIYGPNNTYSHEFWSKDPDHMVTNGAFTLTEYNNDGLVLDKNYNYWAEDQVMLDGIDVRFIDQETTAYAAFIAGELDFIPSVPTAEVPILIAESDEFYIYPMLGTYYYSFNMDADGDGVNEGYEEDGIWSNLNLRKALSYSIDREEIVEALGVGQVPAIGYIPPGFIDDQGNDFFDVAGTFGIVSDDGNFAEAVTLFADAAMELGMTISELQTVLESQELLYNTSEAHHMIAEMMQQMWENNLGFTMPLANQEWAVFQDTRLQGDFSLARGGWLTDYADPYGMLEIFQLFSGYNDPNFYNSEFDTLIAESQATTDLSVHFDKLYAANDIFMDNMPIIPLYHYSDTFLISEELLGWSHSPLGPIDFSRAYYE